MSIPGSPPSRRLAAVLFADLVGYSALASRDEPAALRLLALFQRTARAEVERANGTLVKFMGDGVLAQFGSTESAVQCALALQGAMPALAAAEGLATSLRVGVHVGDVTSTDTGDIHGDGVNVAARLQDAADPGQVLVSEPVWQHLRPRPEFCFVAVGERRLKGHAEPLRVYAVGGASEGMPRVRGGRLGGRLAPAARRAVLVVPALVLVLGAGGYLASAGGAGDRLRTLLGVSTAEAVEPRSIAVLPFRSMSMEPENEYFSDGMTEEILTQLSQLGGLRVTSHTSVMRYKMMPKPVREIGQELGVDHVLEGSVRNVDGQVRITAQLIDARTDEHVWAANYDRDLRDVLALQSEIARQIAAALQAKLTPAERTRMAEMSARAVHPDAYQHYLRGLHEASSGAVLQSTRSFRQALALDPAFAPAHAAAARSYYFLGFFGALPPREAFGKMMDAAEAALREDDRLADAHAMVALGRLHLHWDWRGAERHFRRALELSPSNAEVRHDYAHFLLAMGRNAESATESARASELDPFNVMLTACAGWHRLPEEQYDYAIDRSLRSMQMMPDMFWPELVLGWAHEQKGNYDEAIVAFRKALSHTGGSSFALGALGHALGASGRTAQAREVLAELQRRSHNGYVSAYDFAVVHAGLGEREQALAWLERAEAERAGFVVHLGWDPRLRALRGDPRMTALARKMGLRS